MRGWLQRAWRVALVVFLAFGGLSCGVWYAWDTFLHDAAGLPKIQIYDAGGAAVLIFIVFLFIYLLKEDVR